MNCLIVVAVASSSVCVFISSTTVTEYGFFDYALLDRTLHIKAEFTNIANWQGLRLVTLDDTLICRIILLDFYNRII